MSDLLAIYLIIGLVITALSLLSGDTAQELAERSFLWRIMWVVLITILWFPIIAIITIIVVVGRELNKESEE